MANTGGSTKNYRGGQLKHQNITTYKSRLFSSGSSSSIPDIKFDVFLSFRGEDTRNGFTDHLHAELQRNQIITFIDDEAVDRGQEISPELLKAIEESRFSIVVLSENYAASRWCLDELVHILECLKPGKSIFPIFYHVDPSVVRHQTKSYEKAFFDHEVNYKIHGDKLKKWRFALTAVANLSGWHLNNGREAGIIKKIVQDISSKLVDTSKALYELDDVYENLLRKLKGTYEGFSNDEINHHKFQLTRIDSPHQKLYDAFISFKDDDTARSFTDHLYTALDDKGITYFKDDGKHDKDGKDNVSPKRMQAIKDSRLSFIVLSANYAASTLCLDELVHILECRRYGNKVFPIYHDVVPTVVRSLTGSYGESFTKHEENYKHRIENVQTWRSALVELANISGFRMKNTHEQELIADIVDDISGQLKIMDKWGTMDDFSDKISYENLVGIDSRVKEVMLYLDINLNCNSIIGMWGMAGIGKTTIAKVIYNKICDQFDVCCFLANVREDSQRLGLVALQQKLVERLLGKENVLIYNGVEGLRRYLRSKRILIVLDDVDQVDQLQALVCNADWFGVGSRILITTRDAHLLKSIGVDEMYACEVLNNYESMQLLCLTAFEQNNPMDGYEMVCKRVVDYTNGLPLALRIIGSSLSGRSINEWKRFLESTEHDSDINILQKLRKGYDLLDEKSKDMFLDIACFFNRKKADRVLQVLESCCGLYSRIGMAILIQNSLVTVSDNILIMHDLLQAMGRKIVREECISEPDKCSSRLWHHDDIYDAMTRNSGTEAVRAIVLDHPKLEVYWNKRAFSRLYNLILLSIHCIVQLPEGLEYLPDKLRFFKWWGYPLTTFPPKFYPSQLVELNMCHGNIELLWKEDELFYNLKTIKLSYSQNLVKSPNFKGVPNLERLVLEGCRNLVEIHPSVGILRKLRLLNVKDCSSLGSLPSFIAMESLKICTLSGCSSLEKFPEVLGSMNCLSELYFDGTRALHRRMLDNNRASFLLNIPNITKLSLRNCDLPEGAIPSDIGCLTSLEVLDLSRNKFISLPTGIRQLGKLKVLGLAHCTQLQSVPELPSSIEYVEARDCSSLMTFSEPSTSKDLVLSLISCYHLRLNQDGKCLIITWLKAYLRSLLNNQKYHQELPHLSGRFDIIVPGNRIVEWFRHQSEGPSVRIHLPPKWNNNSWIGFVFCVVLGVGEQCIDVEEDDDNLESEYSHEITCQLYTNEGLINNGFGFCISKGTLFDSSHLWIRYMSNGSFREQMVMWNRASYIEASFGTESQCLEVKKCGLRVVYKQDVELAKNREQQYIVPPIEDLGVKFFSFDA